MEGHCGTSVVNALHLPRTGYLAMNTYRQHKHFVDGRRVTTWSSRVESFDATTFCIYTLNMEFTWSKTKRATNIKAHGLDFIDAQTVFEGMTYTFEDDRFSYGEQRFVTLGLLAGITVSVVHTENQYEIRIISFRKATKRESQIYNNEIQN